MKVKMYKSLDKTSSLFGIRGSYLYIMMAGIVVAVVLGFGIVGGMFGSIIGTLATLAFGAVAYFIVMMLQARFSERSLQKKISSFSFPDYIILKPGNLAKDARRMDYGALKHRK